jgi:hypothetical protein
MRLTKTCTAQAPRFRLTGISGTGLQANASVVFVVRKAVRAGARVSARDILGGPKIGAAMEPLLRPVPSFRQSASGRGFANPRVSRCSAVRRAEADTALRPCFEVSAACVIGTGCSLNAVLREAHRAFRAVLDRYTVADLMAPRHRLERLLRIEAAPPATAIGIEPGA